MDHSDISLSEAAQQGPEQYYDTAIKETRALHERMTSPKKLTATITGSDLRQLKKLLRVSVVLNDCTAIIYHGKGDLLLTVPQPEIFPSMFGCDNIRFNLTVEQMREYEVDVEQPSLSPCFVHWSGKEQRPLMREALPFIEKGSVIFLPGRRILTKQNQAKSWQLLGVDPKQPLNVWEPPTSKPIAQPIPLELNPSVAGDATLFEVTLPFLEGVPLKDLDSLLTDEADLVSAFRSGIRAVVREAVKSGISVAEIVGDVVQPKVVLLDRKLRSLQRVHRIKVGGAAMSSVALAFTAATAGGIGSGLLAIASAGGFGLVANQYSDYVAKRDEIEQDPFYFLWRLRRTRAAT